VIEWKFPPTFKFEDGSFVSTNENWVGVPVFRGLVVDQGQRTTKNKKGELVFDCNSYLVMDAEYKTYYFLEEDLQQ
jgi:hypothetical protein